MGTSDLVFIVGRQRSGTTVFRDLLARHGAMNCDEIFHGDLSHDLRFYRYVTERMKTEPHLIHPEHHARLFRDYIGELRRKSDGKKLAMDVKYFGLNLIPQREDVDNSSPFILNFMRDSRSHVVHIIRPNKLRVFVSEQLAKETGRWSAGNVDHLMKDKPKLVIDVDQAVAVIHQLIQQDIKVSRLLEGLPNGAKLYYDEMFEEDGMFSDGVQTTACRCMDLDAVDATPGNLKMNPEPLSVLVQNFDELSAALSATEHEWMLHGNG